MNNPEAFKEDEVRSIKFVVPGLPFGKQRPKVTVRKFTGSDGKEKKFANGSSGAVLNTGQDPRTSRRG